MSVIIVIIVIIITIIIIIVLIVVIVIIIIVIIISIIIMTFYLAPFQPVILAFYLKLCLAFCRRRRRSCTFMKI